MKRLHLLSLTALVVVNFVISALPAAADTDDLIGKESSAVKSSQPTKPVLGKLRSRYEITLEVKNACKNGGWKLSTAPVFVNQGGCVSYFASETKTETKTEIKSEAKTETKNETHTETKTETKNENQTEAKTEAKNETKTETKTESKTETKTETKNETKDETETKSEAKNACKDGGWKLSTALVFLNQGDCVSHFASEGKSDRNSDGESNGKSNGKSKP